MADPESNPNLKALYQAILQLRGVEECERFFADLCTPAELLALSDRWRAAGLVAEGLPYRAIYEKTGVSTATITRVARALTYGRGGYKMILERMTRRGASRVEIPMKKKVPTHA